MPGLVGSLIGSPHPLPVFRVCSGLASLSLFKLPIQINASIFEEMQLIHFNISLLTLLTTLGIDD